MKKPVLVLSFDINKTLIMRDGGVPVPSMINSLLSETTWGLVKPSVEGGLNELSMCEGEESCWQELGMLDPTFQGNPSDHRPSLDSFQLPEGKEKYSTQDVMTYDDFLESKTILEKKNRKLLKRRFCTHALGPGRRLRDGIYNKLLKSLEMPAEGVQIAREQGILDVFQTDGIRYYYSLVPAFFKLIDTLFRACAGEESSIDVRVLFRTFGDDLDDVGREYNLYCEGLHPVHKPTGGVTFDGRTPGLLDRRIEMPNFIGKIKRSKDTSSHEELLLAHVSYERGGRTVTLTEGASNVYEMILTQWFGVGEESGSPLTYSAGIQDDYEFWAKNKEEAHCGKLFMVDKIEDQGTILQLFFDDNIERSHVHIIDVRQRSDFRPVDIDAIWQWPNGHCDASSFPGILNDVLALNSDVDEYQIAALDSLVKVMPRKIVEDENYYLTLVKNYLLRRGIDI